MIIYKTLIAELKSNPIFFLLSFPRHCLFDFVKHIFLLYFPSLWPLSISLHSQSHPFNYYDIFSLFPLRWLSFFFYISQSLISLSDWGFNYLCSLSPLFPPSISILSTNSFTQSPSLSNYIHSFDRCHQKATWGCLASIEHECQTSALRSRSSALPMASLVDSPFSLAALNQLVTSFLHLFQPCGSCTDWVVPYYYCLC
jgi:hypothetical protein